MDGNRSTAIVSEEAVAERMGPARRRSRMRRQSGRKRVEVTDRDIEICRLLTRYRYLRSTYLYAFFGGNRTRFIERLGNLFHEGYLDRPEQQWQYANCRSTPAVYELGRRGLQFLRQAKGSEVGKPSDAYGSTATGRQFLHQLMVCDIIASIELATRDDPSLRFIGWPEILARAPEATRMATNPMRIPASFFCRAPNDKKATRIETAVIPDALFGLQYKSAQKKCYRFFAVEADRTTMPLSRIDPYRSSYVRKALAYREVVTQGIANKQFNIPNLLMLTCTTNYRHMSKIMSLLDSILERKGNKLFLFKTVHAAMPPENLTRPMHALLATPWLRIVDQPLAINFA